MTTDTSQIVHLPPPAYALVESELYRSGLPAPPNYSFISTLKLRTILFLSPEAIVPSLSNFCRSQQIEIIPLGMQYYQATESWRSAPTTMVLAALQCVLDSSLYPLLIMCSTGVIETGVVIGCLRRLQHWSFSCIVDEYERFAMNKRRSTCLHQIEQFSMEDVSTRNENQPIWWSAFQQQYKEKEDWQRSKQKRIQQIEGNETEALSEDQSATCSRFEELYKYYGHWKLTNERNENDLRLSIVEDEDD